MGIKLYGQAVSAPCRTVMMCAKVLGIDLEIVETNIFTGDNKTPEYLKMNPQHTIPVLKDGDLVITESRAALPYLASAYGKDDSMYPTDLKERAVVDQRLFFDATSLYPAFSKAYYVIFIEKKRPDPANLEKFDEVLGFLEGFLTQHEFAAGDNFTIADCSIVATVTTAQIGCGHCLAKFPKITAYLDKCKELIDEYDDVNGKGLTEFDNFIKSCLKDASE